VARQIADERRRVPCIRMNSVAFEEGEEPEELEEPYGLKLYWGFT
jgi:hypothetical protein